MDKIVRIEEFIIKSSALTVGISKNNTNTRTYISQVHSKFYIPYIIESFEFNRDLSKINLSLDLYTYNDSLQIKAHGYEGQTLDNYVQLVDINSIFSILQKILAKIAEYEHLPLPVLIQLIDPDKIVIDNNHMPHFNFWIDDISVFTATSLEDMRSLKNEKISQLFTACIPSDLHIKQLAGIVNLIKENSFDSAINILDALAVARKNYYESNSEILGQKYSHRVMGFFQKHMSLIMFLLLLLIYIAFWKFNAQTRYTNNFYKTSIGDVTFIPSTDDAQGLKTLYNLEFDEYQGSNTIESPKSIKTDPAPSKTNRTILIEPGQNLYGISLQYYSDPNYYDLLAQYNNIDNPDLIPVGMSLRIPPVETLLSQ